MPKASFTLFLAATCALSLSVAASAPSTLRAQASSTPPRPASTAPLPVSFTVSGGVSLGSFEAGVLYFLNRAVKRSDGKAELRIATGASAGSANSLITLMESCQPDIDDPSQSLGYQTWVPVGMRELFDVRHVTATSLLSREPLVQAMQRVGRRLRQGLQQDCDVVLGVSVARWTPQLIDLTERKSGARVQVPRSDEKFVVRIQGRGPGRPPRIRNYVDPAATVPQPLLVLSSDPADAAQQQNIEQLLQLLYASAAFPLAFAPYALDYCETEPRAAGTAGSTSYDPPLCQQPQHAQFIDGGLFDNSPLRLNHRIVERGLRADPDRQGSANWLDLAEPQPGVPPTVRYVYIDPSINSLPRLDSETASEAPADVLDLVTTLASNFVQASRRRELLGALEDARPGENLREQVLITQNQLPPISSLLGAFFGFFERDFRAFDFYLGMYDGLVSMRQVLDEDNPDTVAEAWLARHFSVLERPLRRDLPPSLLPFACLLSQLEPAYAGHAAACAGADLRNFRILLQVTLDRVHAVCARASQQQLPPLAAPVCMAAARGEPRVQVRGVQALTPERRERGSSEDDLAYTLRLLGDYAFAFHDLGLDPGEAHDGAREIRRLLLSMSSALATAQPSALSSAVIATSGRAGANHMLYEPPHSAAYVTVGTALEVGVNLLPMSWSEGWLKLNLALQISRWQTLATPNRLTLAVTPLLGPEVELFFLSTSVAQWMLGVRAGWQASWVDDAGFGRCDELQAFGDARNCSQLLLHGYVAVALLERLRMQLVLESFPTGQASEFRSRFALELGFGLQFF